MRFDLAIVLFVLVLVGVQPACTNKESMFGLGNTTIDSGNGKGFGGEKEDPPPNIKQLVKIGNSKIHCENVMGNGGNSKSYFLCKLYVVNAGVEVLATGFAEGISVLFSLSGLSPSVENLLDCRNEDAGLSYSCSYNPALISSEISFTVLATTKDSITSQIETINSPANISPVTELPNTWTSSTTTAAPSARYAHTSVWTGSEMIVWGGYGGSSYLNSGGIYDPIADSWEITSTLSAPRSRYFHTAVWLASQMIVWGGDYGALDYRNDGGMYDPVANTWNDVRTDTAPSVRTLHTGISTGTKMIVWGGHNYANPGGLNDGGEFNPVTNTWSAISSTSAPDARLFHSAVWANSVMIIWGGNLGTPYNDGAKYAPSVGWTPINSVDAPSGRIRNSFVWTGSKLIVWGGSNGTIQTTKNDGAMYDPNANAWTQTPTQGAPSPRDFHSSIWTNTKMIVWGGGSAGVDLDTGGQFDQNSNTWLSVATIEAADARARHTAVWTGTQMIIWGGYTGFSVHRNTGGIFTP